ncbi:MAG: antibiotic biosynthesis monooxygenase [Deltaproteobacteria bacterium]|nr:antibiotic biosynthesis monooxygenase [Nannocystaceae bacterium]
MENNYVVILPTEIEEAREEEYLAMWQKAADEMAKQPGFVRTNMYRTVLPNAEFRLVNVAEWKSMADWEEGMKHCSMIGQQVGVVHFSGYEMIRTVVPT